MKKRAISLGLALMMVCALMVTTATAWSNTAGIDPGLYFSGNTAEASAVIFGKSGTSKVTGELFLQEQKSNGDAETIVRWSSVTVYDEDLVLSGSAISRTSGTYYRTGVTSTVYNANGVGETITVYSPWVKCP